MAAVHAVVLTRGVVAILEMLVALATVVGPDLRGALRAVSHVFGLALPYRNTRSTNATSLLPGAQGVCLQIREVSAWPAHSAARMAGTHSDAERDGRTIYGSAAGGVGSRENTMKTHRNTHSRAPPVE